MTWPRRAFGAPLHPLLVHFPVGFLLTVPFLDAAALYVSREPWWTLSVYTTAAGVLTGIVVVVTGFLEYVRPSVSGLDVRRSLQHGIVTVLACGAFATKLLLATMVSPLSEGLLLACTALDVAGWALLVQGVYTGTKQIFGQLKGR